MQTLNIFAWWVALLYIYFLPPVPLPANSTSGWHPPTFKTKRPDKGAGARCLLLVARDLMGRDTERR